MGLYDWYLALRVRLHEGDPPTHVALVITERDLLEPGAYETLADFFGWAFAAGAEQITIYVSVLDPEATDPLCRSLDRLEVPWEIAVFGPEEADSTSSLDGQDDVEPTGDVRQEAPIQISVGLGGKHEFTRAVQSLAAGATEGAVDPSSITEANIETSLTFPEEPDLVIKTGAERLSDFMIWQSVYSELYFTDVNWRDFRRRDYLRAVLEFKNRTRRFGR